MQNLEDIGTGFHTTLMTLTSDTVDIKPIVLLAHSLGGLVVKQVRDPRINLIII